MTDFLLRCVLLAQQTPLEGLSKGFKDRTEGMSSSQALFSLAVLVVMVIGIWLVAQVVERRHRRVPYHGPRRLFLSLCLAHRLTWSDGWLLWRLAAQQRLEEPARLFLEPARLEPGSAGGRLGARAGQLEALRARLFAGLEAEMARSGTSPDPSQDADGEPPKQAKPGPVFPTATSPGLDIPPWSSPGPVRGDSPSAAS